MPDKDTPEELSPPLTFDERLTALQNELKAPKNQRNNFGNYNYRNCEDILEAVKPLLLKFGMTMVITDTPEKIGERYYMKATVTLDDASPSTPPFQKAYRQTTGYAREADTKKGMDESQITGAASSYARKYALNGLFAIDDTRDADTMKPQKGKSNYAPDGKKDWKNNNESKPQASNTGVAGPKQIDVIGKLCNQLGKDLNKILAHFKVDDIRKMTPADADRIIKALLAYKKKQTSKTEHVEEQVQENNSDIPDMDEIANIMDDFNE